MMQMLEAGGIEAFASKGREDRMRDRYPNGNPAWLELDPNQMADAMWLDRNVPDNCAIKLVTNYVGNAPIRPMTVIWMHRDPWEIRESVKRVGLKGFEEKYPESTWEKRYHDVTALMRRMMNDRKSVQEIVDVEHHELMANPRNVCKRIGLPLGASRVIGWSSAA